VQQSDLFLFDDARDKVVPELFKFKAIF